MTEAMTELALFEALALDCRVDEYGTLRYYNALGQIHRVYGPVVEYPDGIRAWWQNGLRHTVDGPAIEYPNGRRDWHQNGRRHRVDGPAVERPDGFRSWWQNGQLHRVDGPAVEYPDGSKSWYISGIMLTETEWQQVASVEHV